MIKFYSAVIVVGLLILPLLGQAQEVKNSDASAEKVKTIAREIMTDVTSCALVTTDQEGIARVRAMEPFLPEADFTVWFGTNPKSRMSMKNLVPQPCKIVSIYPTYNTHAGAINNLRQKIQERGYSLLKVLHIGIIHSFKGEYGITFIHVHINRFPVICAII